MDGRRFDRRVDHRPDPGRDDQPERQPDRDVSRFGEYASRWFLVAGAAAALVMAMAKVDYFWIANVIYPGFVLWAVAGSVLKLVAYRRGL